MAGVLYAFLAISILIMLQSSFDPDQTLLGNEYLRKQLAALNEKRTLLRIVMTYSDSIQVDLAYCFRRGKPPNN